MKSSFLSVAAFLALFTFSACGEGTPGGNANQDTATAGAAQRLAQDVDCDEQLPLPYPCRENCTSDACYSALLKQHEVAYSDTPNYEADGGPYVYKDLLFDGLLDTISCNALFYFEVFQKTNGKMYSNVFVNRYTHDDARTFPLPLMQAIQQKYNSDFSQLNFYWLKKSPRCPAGKDVLMKVILQNGDPAFYNVSIPPLEAQRIASSPELDTNAVLQSAP